MSSSSTLSSSRRPTKRTTTHRPLVLTALVLAMLMSAIEATIVATAMPQIAGSLGGFSLYSWVFSSYLLTQAVTIPVFGKLSDLLGRKPVFIAGIVIFLLGSVLCGFATTMPMLVGFRFLQGIGAGAVQPITATLVGDLYTLEERGRVQGYLAGIWGVSAIVGPLAGGLIVQHLGWPWIFWINLPLGLVTIALTSLFLHENVAHQERSIDYAGAGLLFVGLSALMLALTQGSEWGAGAMAGLLALFGVALVLFLRQERRAPDPMVHLEIWGDRLIALANLATLASGIAMIGLIGFLPTYVQGVQGGSALVAGFALSAMTVGWPLASVAAGRLFVRLGVRRISRAGGVAIMAGALLVALMADLGPAQVGVGSFVMGVGMGLLSTTFMVAIQTRVAWARRGVATA
ncbi:MAG TPA: MFS transporter, partial [Longimicrobiaceae bacterium]